MMKRRLTALILALTLLLGAVPGALALEGDATPSVYDAETGDGMQAFAATDTLRPEEATSILEARLAQYQQLYPKGTRHTNCFTFAQAVQAFLFDKSFNYSYHGNFREGGNLLRIGRLGYDCDPEDETNYSVTGTVDGEISEENVKALFSQAKVGDVIQGLGHNDAGMHTMVVQEVSDTGVVVYHGNWNSVVSVTHMTWSYITAKWPHVLTLYRADNYDSIAQKTTFTVSFNAAGGDGAGAGQTVSWGGRFGPMATPTRSGFTFLGWFTTKTGGTQVKEGDTVLLGKSATLYAHWSGNPMTITFDPCGGTVTPATLVVTNGEPYGTLPTPVREGYEFAGWYTSPADGIAVTSATTVSLAADATLYAHWVLSSDDGTVPDKLEVTASQLNVRDKPSSSGAVLGRFTKGTVVTYLGKSADGWHYVTDGTLTGWCSAEYLKKPGETTAVAIPYETTARLWCRSGPGTGYETVGIFEKGTKVTVTGAEQNGFLPVTANGITGWSSSQYLKKVEQEEEVVVPVRYTVTASRLWCRSGPTTSSATVGSFLQGTVVTATGDPKNGFLPVEALGLSGWCSMDYLQLIPTETCPFEDVREGSWYYDSVVWAYHSGIMSGTSATRFSPDNAANRAMFVTILGRYLESLGYNLEPGAATFPDLDAGAYYYDYVRWGIGAGIVTGSGGRFLPESGITRQEMAVFLYRLAQYQGRDVTVRSTATWNTFSDRSTVASWAKTALQWAVAEGYVNGSGGKLNPNAGATRAQIITVLKRYAEN